MLKSNENNEMWSYVTSRALMKEHSDQCEFRTQKWEKGCSKILRVTEVEDHNCISALEDLLLEVREECKEK